MYPTTYVLCMLPGPLNLSYVVSRPKNMEDLTFCAYIFLVNMHACTKVKDDAVNGVPLDIT